MGERLKGRNAVVTGAGRGIGRAIALALAEEGANIVVCDLGGTMEGSGTDTSPADSVVEECVKLGVKAVPHYGDVSDFSAAEDIVRTCVSSFGKIDILCNIAGILRPKMIFNMSEEEWDRVLAVHLKGTWNLCRHACVLMRPQRYGRIINCTSEAYAGTVGHTNYAAAKGGIVSLTYAIAREMGGYGVTCNAFAPRARTRLSVGDSQDEGLKRRIEAGLITGERLRGMEETRREGADPEYFAPFIAYLASDAAADINGCVFVTSRATLGIWCHPQIVRQTTRDWETAEKWSIDELEKLVPQELLGDYVNPAPPRD
ncbi:MAG: SDR family oxidoreductase [Dehalococcoidia bacterium]|nr:SDR family oxidoreductase [Dehalococcoidia bacterium]